MKFFLPFFLILSSSCQTSFIVSTFKNKNVYKTKDNLVLKKAYDKNGPSNDPREFMIVPNKIEPITVESTKIESVVTKNAATSIKTTTVVTTTIPATTTHTEVKKEDNSEDSNLGTNDTKTTESITTSTKFQDKLDVKGNFIRYTVKIDEGDFKYIKILNDVYYSGTPDTTIKYDDRKKSDRIKDKENPEDVIFQVAKKNLVPNTHYLQSSHILGKTITLPLRIRNEYWNNDNKVIEANLSLAYGFGWKYKLGNNPYQSHYVTTIFYAAGISSQKHFNIAGKYIGTNTDSISAKTDQFAVTYFSAGLTYEYEKFNVGIFFGRDRMFGNLKNWAYQDKWWWGLGIGYSLFQ